MLRKSLALTTLRACSNFVTIVYASFMLVWSVAGVCVLVPAGLSREVNFGLKLKPGDHRHSEQSTQMMEHCRSS